MSFNENDNNNFDQNDMNSLNNQNSLGSASYEQPDYSDFGNSEDVAYQGTYYKDNSGIKKIAIIAIIILAIVLLIWLFVSLFGKGNNKEIVVSAPSVIYAGDSIEFIPSLPNVEKGKLIYYYYSTSDMEVAEFEYQSLISDNNSNSLVAKKNGSVNVKVTATMDGKEVGKYEGNIIICKAFGNSSFASESYSIGVGDNVALNLDLGSQGECYKNVEYGSNNESIAVVDSKGIVTGFKTGTAVITANNGSKTIKTKVNVVSGSKVSGVTGVKLSSSNISVYTGKSVALYATVYPTSATNKAVTWSSSNESIAIVSSKGMVVGVNPGTAVISATTQDGQKVANAKVTVKASTTGGGSSDGGIKVIKAKGVTVSPTSVTLYTNSTTAARAKILSATVSPSNATNKNLIWKTNNSAVAIVSSSGKVTAQNPGTATITVSTVDGGYKATCKITVKAKSYAVSVTSVTLNKNSIDLNVGASQRVTATVYPTNATNRNVTWSSSNTSVATVGSTGTIVAKKTGTATITASTVDGNKTAKVVVNVLCSGSGCGTDNPDPDQPQDPEQIPVPSSPTITASDSVSSGNWHKRDFSLTATGGGSSVEYYEWNEGTSGTSISVSTQTTGETYSVKACNKNGECSSSTGYTVKLDKVAPTCTVTMFKYSGSTCKDAVNIGTYNNGYWTQEPVKLSYSCSDTGGSGLLSKSLTKSGSSEVYTSYACGTGEGVTNFAISAVDNAGNTFNVTKTYKRDTTAPAFSWGNAVNGGTYTAGKVTIKGTCTAKSGIASVAPIYINGAGPYGDSDLYGSASPSYAVNSVKIMSAGVKEIKFSCTSVVGITKTGSITITAK